MYVFLSRKGMFIFTESSEVNYDSFSFLVTFSLFAKEEPPTNKLLLDGF